MQMADPKRQNAIDENPFDGLIINDDAFLSELEGRHTCSRCGKSRKYFCYTCYVPITKLEGLLPSIKLPFKIDIIKHKQEVNGKSTSAHAAVLAGNDVTVYIYPDLPDYSQESNVVLIFPSFDAVAVSELFTCKNGNSAVLPKGYNKTTLMTQKRSYSSAEEKLNNHTVLPINKAVFIDSTWNQSRGIFKDERVKSLQCVVLQNRISQFWRHQKDSPRWYLSTIEAIHQFLIEVHLNMWGVNPQYKGLATCFSDNKYYTHLEEKNKTDDDKILYNGQYDNLLFFFKHMYKVIHTYHGHNQLYAYKRRLI